MGTTVELPADRASPGKARALVQQSLEQGNCARELVDDASLLVSELVTNAVLHARTPIRVNVDVEGCQVRVEVEDSSQVLPQPRDTARDVESGRGLELVARIARAWGAERRRDGKIVWFELGATA